MTDHTGGRCNGALGGAGAEKGLGSFDLKTTVFSYMCQITVRDYTLLDLFLGYLFKLQYMSKSMFITTF